MKLTQKQIKAIEELTKLKNKRNGCMDGVAYKFGKPITLVFWKDGTFEMFDRRVILKDKNGEETYDSVPVPVKWLRQLANTLENK